MFSNGNFAAVLLFIRSFWHLDRSHKWLTACPHGMRQAQRDMTTCLFSMGLLRRNVSSVDKIKNDNGL